MYIYVYLYIYICIHRQICFKDIYMKMYKYVYVYGSHGFFCDILCVVRACVHSCVFCGCGCERERLNEQASEEDGGN